MFEGERISVEGHKESLRELLTILMDNAVKYSGDEALVRVSMKKEGGRATLSVADNGMGIAPKDLPYIFNRFFQATASRTKNAPGGYGLGLSIAKRIVDLHKGEISVVSEAGKGTRFTVDLPLRQPKISLG